MPRAPQPKTPSVRIPSPPASLLDINNAFDLDRFEASQTTEAWIRETFIDEGGPLYNPDHQHLQSASIGVLWTNAQNGRQGRRIVGQCEMGTPQAMGRWAKARAEMQVRDWFGHIPNFILTFDAHYAAECTDLEFCALVEHELFHAGQAKDIDGGPKFKKDGSPAFAIKGHDLEEHIGVVRRYGAYSPELKALIEAASRAPEIAEVTIRQACGTCALRAA